MITSGLVLTLSADPRLAQHAEAALRARPEFTLAERASRWLPVALEAADVGASRDLHDWLQALPGVEFVDVVQVEFHDPEPPSAPSGPPPGAALHSAASLDPAFPTPTTAHARGEL